MDKVGVGIIGSGFISEIHVQSLRQVPEAQIVAVASLPEAQVRSFAEKHGIGKWTVDYHELLSFKEIDLILLGIPNYLHAQVAIDAARAKKHVICEKPLCMNLEDADLMIKTCKGEGVKLMYAEELCFAPKYVRLKQLIEEGALGKVYLIKQSEKHFGPHSDWFWDVEKSGGGVVLDLGCHAFLFFRWLFDKAEAKSVYAQIGTYVHKERTKGEDNSIVIVDFGDGRIGLAEDSWAKRGGMDDRAEVYGSEGVSYANLLMGNSILTYSRKGYGYAVEKAPTTEGWSFTMYEELWNYGFPQEMRHFVRCVREDEEPLVTGEDGRAALEMVFAAYESARKGKKIELPFKTKAKKPIDLYLGNK